jgi:hypothetical protein
MRVYFDFNDWWIGYYRGETNHYVCLLPTVVIRWERRPLPVRKVQFNPELNKIIGDMYEKELRRQLADENMLFNRLATPDAYIRFPIKTREVDPDELS